jgi:hypothetical protein
MEWNDLKSKRKPRAPEKVLVAWQEKHGDKIVCNRYDVLVHWPDGEWTNEYRRPLPRETLPDFWAKIEPPQSTKASGEAASH